MPESRRAYQSAYFTFFRFIFFLSQSFCLITSIFLHSLVYFCLLTCFPSFFSPLYLGGGGGTTAPTSIRGHYSQKQKSEYVHSLRSEC